MISKCVSQLEILLTLSPAEKGPKSELNLEYLSLESVLITITFPFFPADITRAAWNQTAVDSLWRSEPRTPGWRMDFQHSQ